MKMIFDQNDNTYEPEIDAESSFDDVDETEGNHAARIKQLKEEIKKVTSERKDYLDGWQRAKADYLNSQKRFDDERSDIKKRSEIHFIEKILPLADSFSMALDGLKETGEGDTNAWKSGLLQIHGQLTTVFKNLGVSEIGAVGDTFNPHHHEALGQEPVEAGKEDTITKVLQRGYMYRDSVIRPAKVIIGSST